VSALRVSFGHSSPKRRGCDLWTPGRIGSSVIGASIAGQADTGVVKNLCEGVHPCRVSRLHRRFSSESGNDSKPGEQAVRRERLVLTRRLTTPFAALSLFVAFLAGCGGSSDVQEIPEASKKALIKRKVDVEQRPAKSSKAGKASSKGRIGNR
jgi:hypothetical protein